jgi:hypothetical protein
MQIFFEDQRSSFSQSTFSVIHFFSTLIVLFDKIRNLSYPTPTLYLLSHSGLSMVFCHPQSSAIAVRCRGPDKRAVITTQPDLKVSLCDGLKRALPSASPVLNNVSYRHYSHSSRLYGCPPTDSTISVGLSEEEQAAQHEETLADVDSGVGMSDAGYETDSASTTSTSLASSARDYAFENGRRYHSFHEGSYYFPNDDLEQDREDLTHALMTGFCGRLHFVPIGRNPQNILDVGTGTGIWAIGSESIYELETGLRLTSLQWEISILVPTF